MSSLLRRLGIGRKKQQTGPHDAKFKWRFIDANAFIHNGTLKLVEVADFRTLDFVAISYTWSKNMLEWRKWILSLGPNQKANQVPSNHPASEDMKQFHLFFTVVSFIVSVQGRSLFWMDVLSIDQDSQAEKEFFVPKMGSLYAGASVTHAYLTGSAMIAMSSPELHFPVWETRAWTLQEFILSKDVIFCYCFTGDAMRDINLLKENGSSSRLPSPTTELRTPTLDRYRSSSTADKSTFVLEIGAKKVTCTFERKYMGLSLSSYLKNDMFGPAMNQVTGRSTIGHMLVGMRHEPSKTKVITTSMMLLSGRKSTVPEDMMYSVLGLLELGDFKVSYDVGFEEARMRVFEALKPDNLAAVLGTDWGCHQETANKNNDSALPRIIGSEPTIGIVRNVTTSSAIYTRSQGTRITSRKETFRVWKDLARTQSRSTDVVRATLGSQSSRLMVMFCASVSDTPAYATIPTSAIPEEVIRPVVLSGESRLSDEEYFNKDTKYDKVVQLVELGECFHHALFPDPGDEKYSKHTALLTLECEEPATSVDSSGCLVNRGTVLILDASALSSPVTVHTVL
ncbi:hypothetical protein CPC08DRAFT_710151 [Agrocybe pediades]|nr:hypothetical protein CPC08DRAFT_710151 [Agrocybe pediades]